MAMNVTQSMELTQAMQTLKWLDEERRKDKATIATLQEREQNLELQLAQQAAQLQELQSELTGIQGVLSRVSGFEEMITMYKNELLLEMDNREQTRRKELTESERLRRIEYETLTTNLNQLERELRVLPHYDEGLNTLRAESQRLNEFFQRLEVDLTDLHKRVEDPLQAITYLEEQRRTETLRIAALEGDLPDVRKRVETLAQRLPGLEETIQKQRVRIDDATHRGTARL
jgi:chromosome segregation ATPase